MRKFIGSIIILYMIACVALVIKANAENIGYYESTTIKIIKDFGRGNYILCVEGYQWLKFNTLAPQQMFKTSNRVNSTSIPIECN